MINAMISEECLQQFQGEMSNAENAYEYVYSYFVIFIELVQLYAFIEYCIFRIRCNNQVQMDRRFEEKICKCIAGRVPRAEMERKMKDMATRIELLESSLENLRTGTFYDE